MKRKIIAAIFTGMLTAALCPSMASAEIENPEDYMGVWYANYVIYSDESSERHNVAEYLNQYMELRLMEDGRAYVEMSYNSQDPDAAEVLKASWELTDGQILVSVEDGDIYFDTVDGEFIGSIDQDTHVIFEREFPKENPYIYHPETDDPEEIIGCYLGTVNLEKGYEVSLDEETGTFTAHWAGDEYYDPKDYIGSYRITDDNYINIRWREAANEYGDDCYGAVLIDRWNQLTVKENLGNLAEVMATMANDINSGHVFTAHMTEITEGSENQGAVKFIDGDYEISYSYQVLPGADPMVTLTRYDEEYDYEQVCTNYQLREML